jgi:hypothetical protein
VADGESVSGVGEPLESDLWEERLSSGGEQVGVEGFAFGGDEQCDGHRDCSQFVVIQGLQQWEAGCVTDLAMKEQA